MTEELIKQINDNLRWLDQYVKVDNIVDKGMVLDKLSILCVTLSEQVTEAYSLMNELEDEYKTATAQVIKDSEKSVNKAEVEAEVMFADKKRDWTKAKNGYRKLSSYLDRIDKVIESHRQRISVVKAMGLKNMTGV